MDATPAPLGPPPGADLVTLARLGRMELPAPPCRPPDPEPVAPPDGTAVHRQMLRDAVGGVQPRDEAALDVLAALGTTTVGTLVRWLTARPPAPPVPDPYPGPPR